MEPLFTDSGIEAISNAIAVSSTIIDVKIVGTSFLCGKSAFILADAILHSSVRCFNGIPVREILTDSVKFNELDLRGNEIGWPGLLVVASLLPTMQSLTSIDLSNNHLKASCYAMRESLDSDRSVICTDLNISNVILQEFANALCCQSSITSVNLRQNELGVEGAKTLFVTLQKGTSLTSVSVFCK